LCLLNSFIDNLVLLTLHLDKTSHQGTKRSRLALLNTFEDAGIDKPLL